MNPLECSPLISWVESSKSTNDSIREQISILDNLSVIATFEQTAGRGQGDHTWYSSPRMNLTFSILYRFPKEDGPEVLPLPASRAIAVTHISSLAISDYLKEKGVHARIKWPNDVWVGERKICGILIENTLIGDKVDCSIVGIGLNLNERRWPQELPNPVSLHELTGKDYVLQDELALLCDKIAARYRQALTAAGREILEEDFGKLVFRLD